jgi:SH3 domain protein
MTRTSIAFLFAFLLPLAAPAAPRSQYISDQITVTIRDRPANDGAPLGTVRSGAKVTLLESLGPDSFTRIRSADGREGWVPSRFVGDEPAARDQLDQVRGERDQANARDTALEQQLRAAQEQVAKARPAFELAQENEHLRSTMEDLKRDSEAARQRFDSERSARRTLLTGGSLVVAGVLLGLVLPLLGRGRKRRYSEL